MTRNSSDIFDDFYGDVRIIPNEEELNEVSTIEEEVENNLIYELGAAYVMGGIEVPEYPDIVEYKQGKLPYVLMSIIATNKKFSAFGLWDTGCTKSMLAKEFVDKFPAELKNRIVPVEMMLSVAAKGVSSKISGKIVRILNFIIIKNFYPNIRK